MKTNLKWCVVIEARGTIYTYASDSKESAIALAEVKKSHLTASELQEGTIEVCGYDIDEAIKNGINSGLYETVEESRSAFTGKEGTEIDQPYESIYETIKIN